MAGAAGGGVLTHTPPAALVLRLSCRTGVWYSSHSDTVTRLADHAPEPTTKCPTHGEAAQRCLASRPVSAPPSAPPPSPPPSPLDCWHRLQSSAVNMSTNRVDGWAQCGPFDIAQEACLAHLRRNTAAAAAAAAAAATGLLHASTAAAPLDPLLWPLHHFLDFAGVLLEQLWLMLQAVGIILFSSTGLYAVFVMVFQVRLRTAGARRSSAGRADLSGQGGSGGACGGRARHAPCASFVRGPAGRHA